MFGQYGHFSYIYCLAMFVWRQGILHCLIEGYETEWHMWRAFFQMTISKYGYAFVDHNDKRTEGHRWPFHNVLEVTKAAVKNKGAFLCTGILSSMENSILKMLACSYIALEIYLSFGPNMYKNKKWSALNL